MEDLQIKLMFAVGLLVAIPVHEFAHALSAVNNGDDGPRRAGRLSIMPWDHFDIFGAVFCLVSVFAGMGIGWGKPVMVNPDMLRNPKWDMCKIAAWGPFSNLLLAIGFAIPIRLGLAQGQVAVMLLVFVVQNLGLMLFNLIPIGPLDGAKVVAAFLPDQQSRAFMDFSNRYGMMMLLALIMLGGRVLQLLIVVPRGYLLGLLGLPDIL